MISTRGRYALRVMLDLAQHLDECPIPLRDIAKRQGISKKYLEIIVRDLVSGEFIAGTSGKGGGYRLLRAPSEYTIGEILERMEGTLSCVTCLANTAYVCPRRSSCLTLPMWTEYDHLVKTFFFSRRLSDLLTEPAAARTETPAADVRSAGGGAADTEQPDAAAAAAG